MIDNANRNLGFFTVPVHSKTRQKGDLIHAIVSVLIIAVVTFLICLGGIFIGKKFGTCLQRKATIFGGIVLILVGFEIFLSGILG